MSRGVYRNCLKRAADLVLAGFAVIALSPILLVVVLLIRLRLGSPILFRQMRPGLHGHCFLLLKFRTMADRCDAQGRSLPDGDRLTALGRWLRRTSLDELPELLNVLKGEMSLVGPRPLMVQYLGRYSPEQARRHEVRPGITGWTQVNGRNALSWEEKFRLDVWYVDHLSWGLDLKILARTLVAVLARQGISAAGHATMPEFLGTAAKRDRLKDTSGSPPGPEMRSW